MRVLMTESSYEKMKPNYGVGEAIADIVGGKQH